MSTKRHGRVLLTKHTLLRLEVISYLSGKRKKTNKQQNTSHRTPSSLTGLPSRRKRGHYASEGTFGRQVITMGPYGSLETGNTTTRMVTLRRWVGVAWRAQLGSLIIE